MTSTNDTVYSFQILINKLCATIDFSTYRLYYMYSNPFLSQMVQSYSMLGQRF